MRRYLEAAAIVVRSGRLTPVDFEQEAYLYRMAERRMLVRRHKRFGRRSRNVGYAGRNIDGSVSRNDSKYYEPYGFNALIIITRNFRSDDVIRSGMANN